MKRIITVFLALALVLVLFAVPAFASDEVIDTAPDTEENAPDTVIDGEQSATDGATDIVTPPTEGEISPPSEEERFRDELLDFVSNGANWAKIGGVVLALAAAVGAIIAKLDKFKGILDALLGFVKGKATKEETEKIVGDGMAELKKEYDEKYSALLDKYNEQAVRNNELTAVMTVLALQLVKSPYARTEIMGLLSSTKTVAGGVKDIVEVVEEEIAKAEAEEEKTPTPALDAVKASVGTTDDGTASGAMNMGW